MEIPVPPAAVATQIDGSFGQDLIASMNAILGSLREKYGKFDEKVYRLPKEASWSEIESFYENTARAKNWERDKTFPVENVNSKVGVWKPGGIINQKPVAVALVETGAEKQKFLVVFSGQ